MDYIAVWSRGQTEMPVVQQATQAATKWDLGTYKSFESNFFSFRNSDPLISTIDSPFRGGYIELVQKKICVGDFTIYEQTKFSTFIDA